MILELLQYERYDQPWYDQVGDLLIALLQGDRDPDVRIHAAAALSNYVEARGVLAEVLRLVCNTEEVEIVRDNAFAALERRALSPSVLKVVESLLTDPVLGTSAQRLLTDRQSLQT